MAHIDIFGYVKSIRRDEKMSSTSPLHIQLFSSITLPNPSPSLKFSERLCANSTTRTDQNRGGQARRAPLVTLMSVFVSVSGLRVPIVMYSVAVPFKTCFYSLQFVTACLRCPVLRTVLSGREGGGSQACIP